MRIVVVGPGALGCLFAAKMALNSGHEIWLLDYDRKRAQSLRENGLILREGNSSFNTSINATSNANDVGHADLIFLCVKSKYVKDALKELSPLVSDETLLVVMQNGIAHHKVVENGYDGHWAIGLTSQGAFLESVGRVVHGGKGKTVLGYKEQGVGMDHLLKNAADVLTKSDIASEISNEIITHVWNKFLVNIGINALTVILDCPNGKILESAKGKERMRRLVNEAAMVATAKGIKVNPDPLTIVEAVCRDTCKNISSMLQDVRLKKPTEIDAINGALLKEADSLGISVPANQEVVEEIKNIEASYL